MPSPMDACDNLVNIEVPSPSALDTMLKRKLEDSSEELTFPCKKVAVCPPSLVTSNSSDGMTNGAHTTASKPQQPKLTKAEREAVKAERAREKDLERQKREDEKARREEERIKKAAERDELKKKKDAEKTEMKRRRESEKEEARQERERKDREREEQRRKKEEEVEKKNKEKEDRRRKKKEEIERKNKVQLRLNDFFMAPKKKSESPVPQKVASISDYGKCFQPFHVRQDVVVAPTNRFLADSSILEVYAKHIDNALSTPTPDLPSPTISPVDHISILIPACKSRRKHPRWLKLHYTAKDLIGILNEAPPNCSTHLDPYEALRQLSHKHLHFAEDVRPAYNGTFTRITRLTPRNPFKKDTDVFAYDYDSEAEWEFEPEDGENLDDESVLGDDDASVMDESGDEEDRAFLDDEDLDDEGNLQSVTPGRDGKIGGKKGLGKRFVAPVVPVIKGVCWEVGGIQGDDILAGMRAGILLFDEKGDGLRPPIDPLSTEYWISQMPPPPPRKCDAQMLLRPVDASGTAQLVKPTIGALKSKIPFPENMLGEFLKAIQGATHNQILLIELLKKQFPSATKGGIIDKLKEVAFRTGRKDTDHWEIRKEFLHLVT